jgi:hypothetical protein
LLSFLSLDFLFHFSKVKYPLAEGAKDPFCHLLYSPIT